MLLISATWALPSNAQLSGENAHSLSACRGAPGRVPHVVRGRALFFQAHGRGGAAVDVRCVRALIKLGSADHQGAGAAMSPAALEGRIGTRAVTEGVAEGR